MEQRADKQIWAISLIMQLLLILLAQLVGVFLLKENLILKLLNDINVILIGKGLFLGLALFGLVLVNYLYVGFLTEWSKRVVLPVLKQFEFKWLLAMGGLAGVSEELFFRGALQPLIGIILASLLFGFVHYYGKRDLLPYGIIAAVMGLIMGLAFEATNSLVVPVVAHSTYNVAVILALKKGVFD